MIRFHFSTRLFAASFLVLPLFLALSITTGSSQPSSLDGQLHTGPETDVGNGKAWSWVRTDEDGHPTAVGVSFTEAALHGLPDALPGTEFTLEFPSDVQVAPFNHASLDWNPMGHEPEGIYTAPHFDVHFYMISHEERDAIAFGPDSLVAPDEYLPAGHVTDGMSLPRMGVHWVSASAHEFHGQPFSETFIYGYSRGKLIFLEPMITRELFESKTTVTKELSLPARIEKPGYYPARYGVYHDASTGVYYVTLEDLRYRTF